MAKYNKMYDAEEIDKTLECQLCRRRFDIPLILPCGETVCQQCVRDKLDDDYEKKLKFKCLLCDDEHEMPKRGLPINESIQRMLDIEAKPIFRGEVFEKLQNRMTDLDEKRADLADLYDSKEQVIRNHYEIMRQDINASTARRVDEINAFCDQLIEEVNEKEEENLKYVREIESNALNERIERVKQECAIILNPSAKTKDNDVNKSLETVNALIAELSARTVTLTNSLYPNGVKIGFAESEKIESSEIIGKLVSQQLSVSPREQDKGSFEEKKELTETAECIRTLTGHIYNVNALTVLSNGTLVSCSDDQTLKMWNTFTGRCIRTLTGHSGLVNALTELSNGTLVSGSRDATVKMWNTSTGKCIRTLTGHSSYVNALTVLTNGTLVSGSSDATVMTWNTSTGECIQTLTGHKCLVFALTELSNGTLVCGSTDSTVKMWNTSSDE